MHFYPIGNTPAVCLTQCLPLEKQANILLLGCGDVRNILFTAHSDGKECSAEGWPNAPLTCDRWSSNGYYLL